MRGHGPNWRDVGDDLAAARATLSLVGVLVAIQIVLAALGGVDRVPQLYLDLGLSRNGLAHGKVWELATYGLIHANWLHLALNSAALLALGPRLERIGGLRLWGWLMLGGLLAGGGLHLLADGGGDRPLVGASGCVFAAVLWLTGVSPGSRMWPVPVSGKSLGIGMLLASGGLMLVNPALGLPVLSDWGRALASALGDSLFEVSHACHFGGGLIGWMAARWTLRPPVTLEKLQRDRRRREKA
ncbi:rhomboid family intramembrane serine protease [Haloferula sp. A504]|uniref:rhomboid family intramembrane serine protease n=1 Tax=Haloferula sp. A504 TaxID=3373601 RepID=UPI0031C16553|nr:rhomboid family intramembrane serine protease [Verrucomicrobiaceae bacterium E54]